MGTSTWRGRWAATAGIVGAWLAAASAAHAGGLAAQVVREPAFGLPHFFAATDVDLARENGREIAKDRLGQLVLLARVGRGTLSEVFAVLDPSTLDDDIVTRQSQYTSRELNTMFAKLRQRERNIVLAYCAGVNDTIEQVYTGASPEPLEVNALRFLGFSTNLFGNAFNISDQVDPYYKAPADDPEHPTAGFQFTPELAMSIGILEVRNFGLESFEEPARLAELQALVGARGDAGSGIWDDLNFLNDPLAPVTVPDPTTPGYGGPLARRRAADPALLAAAAGRAPRFDYAASVERRRAAAAKREQFASRWGAWPKLGSYAWAIAGSRSTTGFPWLGGFPQTGIQTPSIMHFADNRSSEGIIGIGMEFAGAPFVLIGHTDQVAWTTTTALLRTVETFFEQIANENGDALRYNDEGKLTALLPRTEIFRGINEVHKTMWRAHETQGNGGSRPVLDFIGDTRGTATAGSATTLDATGAFDAGLADGYIAIVGGTAAGEIRHIATVVGNDRIQVDTDHPWTVAPDAGSEFVAVHPGKQLIAVASDSPLWLEESTSVLGFSLFQRAVKIHDIRTGARLMPSTHNFVAADDKPFNQVGTELGHGNIGYWASGFSRIRSDGTDVRLPIDGSKANPFVAAHGTVASAAATTLVATEAVFSGQNLAALPQNYRYEHPTEQGREYIVAIVGGSGYKQTRRIASSDASSLTIEYPWGVIPSPGDSFEVYPIVGMPEAINPVEGYMANWNNKAATSDDGNDFGRLWRHLFILQRLGSDSAWDRNKQRMLNKDVAGLDSKGDLGRFLLPRIHQAVDGVGNGGNPAVDTVLARLEAQQAAPDLGRNFIDPVSATTDAGEVAFMNQLINQLAVDIYGDELNGAVPVPTGARALSMVQHAIDSAAGDLPQGYQQKFGGDYFNGMDWRVVVRDSFSRLASQGIPADTARPQSTYRHPLAALLPGLEFEPTPFGNRGTYEQIVDVGPVLKGEFIFPLGQSGLIQGTLASVSSVDRNFTSLQPIWRDWRFVPMLPIARDLANNGTADSDGDGVPDAYERWYFGDLSHAGDDDSDGDCLTLADEYAQGVDPTAGDTDGDGIRDGFDTNVRDRLGGSQCGGDCNADLDVTIDELLRAVGIDLGEQPLERCPIADLNGDGQVSVDEIIRGVKAALIGCRA
jgi:hypothetical protein